MNPIFPALPHPLGVYTLARLMETRPDGDLYIATQSHVERAVVAEVMRPGAERTDEARFLESARMRVAADSLPHVAQVYESLRADGLWFLTQELPKGASLADLSAAEKKLSVRAVCRVISAAAEIYTLCAKAGLSTRAMSAATVFVDEDETPHFLSPVTATDNGCDAAVAMTTLGEALNTVRPVGVPGENRTHTLLQWMRQGYEGEWLDWGTIATTAATVAGQLGADKPVETEDSPSDATLKRRQRKQRRKLLNYGLYAVSAAAVFLGCASLGLLFPQQRVEILPAAHDGGVVCKEGTHPLLVADTPVSKGEYARFLEAWKAMSPEEQAVLHAGVPSAYTDHTPEGWDGNGGDAPVTGVSYWDALVYARFMKAALPSAAALQTARRAVPAAKPLREWVTPDALPASLMSADGALLLQADDTPFPLADRAYRAADLTFRITTPNR